MTVAVSEGGPNSPGKGELIMRTLLSCAVVVALACVAVAGGDKSDDTPKAAKTRKLLKTKIKEIEWKDTRFEECMNELKEEVKGLSIIYGAGISRNRMITYKVKDRTVEQILDEVCKKVGGIGYVVISKKGNAYDGSVQMRQGDERGFEKKK
jgi:hypothetical protein